MSSPSAAGVSIPAEKAKNVDQVDQRTADWPVRQASRGWTRMAQAPPHLRETLSEGWRLEVGGGWGWPLLVLQATGHWLRPARAAGSAGSAGLGAGLGRARQGWSTVLPGWVE